MADRVGVLMAGCISCLFAMPAQAQLALQDPDQAPTAAVSREAAAARPASGDAGIDLGKDRITIGIGPAIVPSYIGSDQEIVVPGIAAQGQVGGFAFSVQGTGLTIDLIRDDGKVGWKVQAGPAINVRLDRTTRVRDRQVAALGDLKTAWEPGLWFGIQRTGVVTSPYDTFSFSIGWQRDVAGAYRGGTWSPALSYGTPLSHRSYVSLTAGADHVGRRFGDYYYDVDQAGSAASGLAPYDDAGRRGGWKDWNLGILAERMLTGDLTHGLGLFGSVNYARLLGRYARSPIVADAGSRDQWSYTAGLAYTF